MYNVLGVAYPTFEGAKAQAEKESWHLARPVNVFDKRDKVIHRANPQVSDQATV